MEYPNDVLHRRQIGVAKILLNRKELIDVKYNKRTLVT